MIPRRLVALGVAALLLAGAGIAVAATRDDSDETAAPAPTTTVPPVETTSSTVPDTTTTTTPVVATSTPPSSRVTATPTTVRRGATTVPRVTTTRPPTSPTTTTAGAAPSCKPDQIEVSITTDRPSYIAGQEVKATSTLRNKSSDTCFYNGYGFTSAFKEVSGRTIIGQSVIADSFADVPLRPGQTITQSGSWDQRLCSEPACGRAPLGPYTAAATWNFAAFTYEFTTTFNLV